MFSSKTLVAATALLLSHASFTDANAPQCGPGNSCPSDTPCCSQYGQCGVGAYCLGGCDPQFSHSLESCVVAPVCTSRNYKFTSLDGIQPNTAYLGDASKADWVSEGRPIAYDNSVMLTMAPDTVGTLLASTHYVWYGKITAKMVSSAGPGVVTAFIMMSDVKDEIDFEFIGADLQNVQSNYYWQGVLDYHNSKNLSVSSTNTQEHTYEIDWKPDSLTWSIDGQVLRTLNQKDTWNATSGHYDYPQTPARIMMSLWPAGLSKNGKGTIDWAGGLIDWNSPDMTNGYYSARVYEVDVQCYDPPQGANTKGKNSYQYNDISGTNNTVSIVNDLGILSSFYATGEDEKKDPDATSSANGGPSSTGSAAKPSDTDVETVPGLSGAGSRGSDTVGESGTSAAGSGSGDGSGSSGSVTNGQFIQNAGGSGSAGGGGVNMANGKTEKAMQGSVFAVLIAFVALCVL